MPGSKKDPKKPNTNSTLKKNKDNAPKTKEPKKGKKDDPKVKKKSAKDVNHNRSIFVSVMATVLSVLAIIQMIWALLLFTNLMDILRLTGSQLVITIVLLSGLVTLPVMMIILFFTVNQSESMNCKYNYWYWTNLTIVICINTIGAISSAVRLYTGNTTMTKRLKTSMEDYKREAHIKHVIDDIQWTFKCCGLYSYMDWYGLDWFNNEEYRPSMVEDQGSSLYGTSVSDQLDEFPGLIRIRKDSVPYSCCKSGACVPDSLVALGTATISVAGCNTKIWKVINMSMIGHLIFFLLLISLELLLFWKLQNLVCKKDKTSIEKGQPKSKKKKDTVVNLFRQSHSGTESDSNDPSGFKASDPLLKRQNGVTNPDQSITSLQKAFNPAVAQWDNQKQVYRADKNLEPWEKLHNTEESDSDGEIASISPTSHKEHIRRN